MFFRQNKIKARDSEKQQEYQEAIERVYTQQKIDLAIAGISYFDAYTFRKDVLGNKITTPRNFSMSGVVHEPYDGVKRVICNVEFVDREAEEELIGFCLLTHLVEDEKQKTELRKLSLEVSIWDASGEWRKKSYNALRDAAISGNQFLHFGVEKETIDTTVALAKIKEEGCGPTLKLHEFVMWPTIILPKAPDWARKEV